MSARRPQPRLDALDRLALVEPEDGEQEILSILIELLLGIDEITVAKAAQSARERTDP